MSKENPFLKMVEIAMGRKRDIVVIILEQFIRANVEIATVDMSDPESFADPERELQAELRKVFERYADSPDKEESDKELKDIVRCAVNKWRPLH
jgi:hypothetical protein